MSDADWIKKVRKIKDPFEMLECILENESFFGYDPYYKELRDAMTDQVRVILDKTIRLHLTQKDLRAGVDPEKVDLKSSDFARSMAEFYAAHSIRYTSPNGTVHVIKDRDSTRLGITK